MKWFSILAASAALAFPASPELAGIKTVYMLPMSAGLDQYLAVRLTASNLFQVVTDPQKADAVFTDRIGASLEESMHELFDLKPQDQDKSKNGDDGFKPTMAPLSRGKGSIFLVSRTSRAIVWSIYALPKSQQAGDMNDLARYIAEHLAKDRKGK